MNFFLNIYIIFNRKKNIYIFIYNKNIWFYNIKKYLIYILFLILCNRKYFDCFYLKIIFNNLFGEIGIFTWWYYIIIVI